MRIKLTRKETVAACNFLSGINLRGAEDTFAHKVIMAQIALHAVAKKIQEENDIVRSRFTSSDEAKEKCSAFAKAYQDMIATRKDNSGIVDAGAVNAFNEAFKEARPYTESIDNEIKALEEKFKFSPDIELFSLDELVSHYVKQGVDFSIRSFEPITKLIKGA